MKAYHQGQLDFFCGIYAFINAMKLIAGLNLAEGRDILAESLREFSARPALWDPFLNNRTDHYWVLDYLLGRYCRSGRFACRVAALPLAPLAGAERQELRRQRDKNEAAPKLYGITGHELSRWLGLRSPQEFDLDSLDRQGLFHREAAGADSAPGYGLEYQGDPLRRELTRREKNWNLDELWPLLQSWLPLRRLFSGLGSSLGGLFEGGGQKRCLILRFHRYLYADTTPVISHWSTGHEFAGDVLHLFDCTAEREAVHSLALKDTVAHSGQIGNGRLLQLEPDSLIFIEKV